MRETDGSHQVHLPWLTHPLLLFSATAMDGGSTENAGAIFQCFPHYHALSSPGWGVIFKSQILVIKPGFFVYACLCEQSEAISRLQLASMRLPQSLSFLRNDCILKYKNIT
jgi:hypothetical protein